MVRPIDRNNLDGEMGNTAAAVPWPENLSDEAKEKVAYLKDNIGLYRYNGKYILTDGTGSLTTSGAGTMENPMQMPYETLDDLNEVNEAIEAFPWDYIIYIVDGIIVEDE